MAAPIQTFAGAGLVLLGHLAQICAYWGVRRTRHAALSEVILYGFGLLQLVYVLPSIFGFSAARFRGVIMGVGCISAATILLNVGLLAMVLGHQIRR